MLTQRSWASAGEGKRGPWATKIVCFSNIFEKNSILYGVFWAKSMFWPPWKILSSPGKTPAKTYSIRIQ